MHFIGRLIFVCALALAFNLTARSADAPLFEGLPPEIHVLLPEQRDFVPFDPIPNHHAPMLARARFEGDTEFKADDVFIEEFWALLPPRAHILTWRDSEGRVGWDYPVGTRVIHRIWLRSQPRTIFELRILWKRNDGTWAYGLYMPTDPSNGSNVLRLLREGRVQVEIRTRIESPNASGSIRITGSRINPHSCQQCHYMRTPARHQYRDAHSAGPCGFVPGNPSITTKWAPAYQRLHGYWPFR